ncbi:MAG TPA: type 4a pilus biogenesis protein PilO [Chthonomonadales bacterium]|nr:type 4a pilus biogenesis protein PilO [Chthonomonadales bacterium]
MINFRQKEYAGSSAAALLAIVVLAGSLLVMLLPQPSAAISAQVRARQLHNLRNEISKARIQTKQTNAANSKLLWQGNPQEVTSLVLKQITGYANQRNLTLTAFRPQRMVALQGIVELPYSVHITGPYLKVREVVSLLDSPGNRLALSSVQFASSDESSSLVTATVNLAAFISVADAAGATEENSVG